VNLESVMVILPLCNQYAVGYTYSYGLTQGCIELFYNKNLSYPLQLENSRWKVVFPSHRVHFTFVGRKMPSIRAK
jgi:hypothetical protein